MSSDTSTLPRRVPQRARGERRVAELLDAAASVIAEVGYEAATMTAISERAGASIGVVYQYFPNKEAVVRALRSQYGDEMEALWVPLTQQADGLRTDQLVDGIFAVVMKFIDTRPAYVPLLDAPSRYERDPAARNRLREHFAVLFRKKKPALTPTEAFRIANVTLQIVKSVSPIYVQAKGKERQEVLREFKLALTAYLLARLGLEE
jgi:AcrR family transcriptional regulator